MKFKAKKLNHENLNNIITKGFIWLLVIVTSTWFVSALAVGKGYIF